MKKAFVLALALVAAPLVLPGVASATIDCHFPVSEKKWTGKITSGVNIRDLTCMDSNKVGTVSGGAVVAILGEADGWYLIKTDAGVKGYVWQDFITVTSKDGLPSFTGNKEVVKEKEKEIVKEVKKETTSEKTSIQERLKGRILLQVENNGEAWYVRPDDGKRYYMKDGATAYEMMRAFGLGISEADFAKLDGGNKDLRANLKGKIVLRVQLHGEAYYIHPEDSSIHYLKDGTEAYRIMRELSLGITNKDLSNLPQKDFDAFKADFEAKREEKKEIDTSDKQGGVIPVGVDVVALNEYWLGKINSLRAAKGLRQLVLDQRWVDTATEWATYMGETGATTHNRPDGKSMHQWIDTKGLPFTVRYSEDGWRSNYFTENISWGIASEGSTADVKGVLNDTLEFFLAEESYNGDHYRTIYHADWNSVGVGFYFLPSGNGYKVFVAMHYGSLVQ